MADIQFEQAYNKHMAGNLQSARMLYERLIKRNPRHIDAKYMLGTLLAETGVLELGLMHLKSAATLKPDSPMIRTNLGHVYLKLGRLELARDCYQKALQLNPHAPEIMLNLGIISQQQGKLEEAVTYYEQCRDLNPDLAITYSMLGKAHRDLKQPDAAAANFIKYLEHKPESIDALLDLGNILAAHQSHEDALVCFKQILDIDPENEAARHAVAALTGETPTAAPRGLVEQLFDEMSDSFEHHLGQLGYRAPVLLKEMVVTLAGNQTLFERAVDLGCGTGLSGDQFRPMVKHLSGMDLSPKMVERAGAKEVYDELTTGDVCQYLESSQQKYDLIMATDVFPYIGDLSFVFKSISQHALNDCYFIFSTETAHEQDYVLRSSGRFAHSRHYIETLANAHQFQIADWQATDLRMEGTQPVKGELFVLKFCRTN
ncbi:MAG: tetratricopeptide repeat protein [Gallionella sp.]